MIEIAVKGITLVSYIVTIAVAIRYARKEGLDCMVMQWTLLWSTFGALVGGHLYYVLSNLQLTQMNPLIWIDVLGEGKGVIGALLGSMLIGMLYLSNRKAALLEYADAAVPAVAIGYAIIRIGCFINGDDFGVVSDVPWAVQFVSGTDAYHVHLERGWILPGARTSLTVHPTQLYHMFAAGLGFLLFAQWRSSYAGERMALGITYYGITRFVIQFYRDDHYLIENTLLDMTQWFCLMFMVSGLALWVYLRRNDSTLIPVVWSKRS
jgi:phosphatidylglycerol---prolipoprotein diacylglyceryl transferase